MSDNEDTVETTKKEKKPRTQKQKEAFEKMIAKRKEIDQVKNAHKEALRKEKEMVREDRVKKIKEVEEKMSKYKSEDEEDEIVEPVKISKPKPKPKKKRERQCHLRRAARHRRSDRWQWCQALLPPRRAVQLRGHRLEGRRLPQ